jgi:hypothetical protein
MNFKTILACAALLIGIGTATAAVESDIVGYQTVTLTKKWNLLAVQFGELGVNEDAVAVNSVFCNVEGLADKDQLQIPEGKSYTIVEWNATTKKWCAYGNPNAESDAVVTRGRGVWLQATGASDANPVVLTVSGAIALNRDADDFSTGYTIVCPPAPLAGTSINTPAMVWDGLADKDQLQVPEGSSYNIAEWNATTKKWCAYGNANLESTLTFPEGAACWLMTKSANASMTFSVK